MTSTNRTHHPLTYASAYASKICELAFTDLWGEYAHPNLPEEAA